MTLIGISSIGFEAFRVHRGKITFVDTLLPYLNGVSNVFQTTSHEYIGYNWIAYSFYN